MAHLSQIAPEKVHDRQHCRKLMQLRYQKGIGTKMFSWDVHMTLLKKFNKF